MFLPEGRQTPDDGRRERPTGAERRRRRPRARRRRRFRERPDEWKRRKSTSTGTAAGGAPPARRQACRGYNRGREHRDEDHRVRNTGIRISKVPVGKAPAAPCHPDVSWLVLCKAGWARKWHGKEPQVALKPSRPVRRVETPLGGGMKQDRNGIDRVATGPTTAESRARTRGLAPSTPISDAPTSKRISTEVGGPQSTARIPTDRCSAPRQRPTARHGRWTNTDGYSTPI